jgi:hypothetical protein
MTPPPNKPPDKPGSKYGPTKLGQMVPFSTPLPEGEMYPDDEVSKVHNEVTMYAKLEKLDRMLIRMADPIAQIPEVKEKVEHIGERVTRVEERLSVTKERVDVLNGAAKKPHDCFQVDNIERVEVAALSLQRDRLDDTKKLVQVAGSVETVVAQVEEIKKNTKDVKDVRRGNHYFWIGTVASFVIAVLSSVWYLRGLSADIQLESTARAAQFREVEKVLNKVSEQSDPEPVVQQIKQLKTTVEQNNDTQMAQWCAGLSEADVQRIKAVLPRQSWPECDRLRVQ